MSRTAIETFAADNARLLKVMLEAQEEQTAILDQLRKDGDRAWQSYQSRREALLSGVGTLADLKEEYRKAIKVDQAIVEQEDAVEAMASRVNELQNKLAEQLDFLEVDWLLQF